MTIVFSIILAIVFVLFHGYFIQNNTKNVASGLCKLVFDRSGKLVADCVGGNYQNGCVTDSGLQSRCQ